MLKVREMTAEEQAAIERLARSRTAEARLVERAKGIALALRGERLAVIAAELGLSERTVRRWLGRFNELGIEGLQDRRRPGRPATYSPEEVAEVIALALTPPRTLDLPFASWTLDRLQAYLNEHKGIAIKRSRIDEILRAEGLRWRRQETWFGERVDPEFAEKRGSSKGSTKRHPNTAW